MIWKHNVIPEQLLCPKEFCFFWIETQGCTCSFFGTCIRDNRDVETDWFEPVEPLHDRCKLPLFYFRDYSSLSETEKDDYNNYFRVSNQKRVLVRLKFTEKFYNRRKGCFKNSVISTVAIFDRQVELDISDSWSIIAEIYDEPDENRELLCNMRFLAEGAQNEYLNINNRFTIRATEIYAEGIVVSN